MENFGEKIKEIIETNNSILGWKKELEDLDKEKGGVFFDLEKFLDKHYQLMDFISKNEDKLRKLYKNLDE